jgi:hypothetical protein
MIALLASPALADDTPINLFGSPGLLSTPTARFAPDGQLTAGVGFLKNNQHYNLGFEFLPWLETSFRYSGLQRFQSGYPVYFDRSFAIKARLWDETDLFPAVALGINDVVGTGVYGGEYLVASKQFGDLDTSLGIGWGRMGSSGLFNNPLAELFPSFKTRVSYRGVAGQAEFQTFFHGPKVGLFGGAVWHTPLDGLSLLVEYDSDTYQQERATGNLLSRSQVNYGLSYALTDSFTMGLGWLYGTTVGGNLSIKLDTVHLFYPEKIGPAPPPVAVRSDIQQREALLNILGQRDPDNRRRLRARQVRSQDRNGFIDALWRQGSDYADVAIRHDTLELTVTGTISSVRCQAIVRLAAGAATDIRRVRLSDPLGRRSIVCDVPRTVNRNALDAEFTAFPAVPLEALPVNLMQTIDATRTRSPVSRTQAERAIRAAMRAQFIAVDALTIGDGELTVYYSNLHYFAERDALDRLTRILTANAPPDIEKFRLIAIRNGIPQREFDVLRSQVERNEGQDAGILDEALSATSAPMTNPALAATGYPRFSWGIYPQFRQELFDPSQPVGVQFLVGADASLELLPGFSLNGAVDASLYDDFNTSRTSNSQLPHVRSDFLNYLTQGRNGIGMLDTEYRFRITPEVFAVARAGLLENMFAGAGGEVLWRPEGQRWALGADMYEVWQRNFDRLFGLRPYHVFTGHVSLYYASPWHNLNFELRAGQYLAGDRGITLEVTRRFSTGVEIGAFMTRTNVSAQKFGEGSFDKGIIIRIPLQWMLPMETQSQFALDLRPVQRDGGQTLAGDAPLYEETRRASEAEMNMNGAGP